MNLIFSQLKIAPIILYPGALSIRYPKNVIIAGGTPKMLSEENNILIKQLIWIIGKQIPCFISVISWICRERDINNEWFYIDLRRRLFAF